MARKGHDFLTKGLPFFLLLRFSRWIWAVHLSDSLLLIIIVSKIDPFTLLCGWRLWLRSFKEKEGTAPGCCKKSYWSALSFCNCPAPLIFFLKKSTNQQNLMKPFDPFSGLFYSSVPRFSSSSPFHPCGLIHSESGSTRLRTDAPLGSWKICDNPR